MIDDRFILPSGGPRSYDVVVPPPPDPGHLRQTARAGGPSRSVKVIDRTASTATGVVRLG